VLVHGGAVAPAAVEAHFAPALLAKLPAAQAAAAFAELAKHTAGMTIAAITARDPAHVVLHARAADGRFAIVVDVDPANQRIAKLDVTADAGPQPRSIDDAIAQLRSLAPQAQLLIAELRDGTCNQIASWNAAAGLAIASQFKLYVLLALVDHIAAGKARWDDTIAARDDWRSLPGGVTQDERAGTRLSLRTLAERMIAISDNTAADYLLYFVGRDAVEAALRTAHHAHPERNTPLLATRELFWIKLELARADIDRYVALAPAQRRAFLDGLAGKLPRNAHDFWPEPREIERIEWFASADDLCNVMAALHARMASPAGEPLRAILGKNPGLDAETPATAWRFVGFKGGSEPGVVGATWLLERADQRWFVVQLGLNAPHAPGALDEGAALGIAHGVIDLVGRAR
jgi:beta-lactamase class A